MTTHVVKLKPGREKSLKQRHPWIFSGALDFLPDISAGDVLPVHSAAGEFIARAYFNPGNSLVGRVLTFQDLPVEIAIRKSLESAYAMRRSLGITGAYRLVNAEADGLPGLIVDCYGDLLVVQIHTLGMEKLKSLIVKELVNLLKPKTIYEKSLSAARHQEGLAEQQGLLYGEMREEVEIVEEGLRFIVPLIDGQKTGFFLDQREMRKLAARFAKGRRVLNCFSYSGAFAIHALKDGASYAESVDLSQKALALAERNTNLNALSSHKLVQADAFDYLKNAEGFDFVILDPPAFVKKRSDLDQACRGYKEINRLALEKISPGGLLLTSSCSYYMSDELFQTLLFQAALEAGRSAKILSRHYLAFDHPIALAHPEGAYLKSLLLYVE